LKTLFFMGINRANVSGVSWKMWRIHRSGQVVEVQWGAADLKNRRPRIIGSPQRRQWTLRTEAQAIADVSRRFEEKLREGYQVKPVNKAHR